jgi:DNA-damage-inducible protein D
MWQQMSGDLESVEKAELPSVPRPNTMYDRAATVWSAAMSELQVFHFNGDRPNFEAFGHDNGFRHWLASDLMRMLDYSSMGPIKKAINKAMAACANLGVSINENFRETKAATGVDWCLSRFACYLTVMNGDPRNQKIALAQAYFVTQAEAFRQYVQQADGVERVLVRGEVSEREKALSGTAKQHGVENYAFFQNAGYRGLYNMDFKQLVRKKGVPASRSILDFMGKTELAANLFRITQTEEKIRNEDILGQRPLERAHESVGREVRDAMRRIGGTPPEQLPLTDDIKKVRSGLKRTGKEFAKIDGKKS